MNEYNGRLILLNKIVKFDDIVKLLKKIATLLKIGQFYGMKSITIKYAISIILKNHFILFKRSATFLDIFGCLSLSAEINQENVSDDDLKHVIFFMFKRNYPFRSKIELNKIIGKFFGTTFSKMVLRARLRISTTLADFTHASQRNRLNGLDSTAKSFSELGLENNLTLMKKKHEFFSKKYRFERKLILFFLSLFFQDKFFFFFWIWIKTKLNKKSKSRRRNKEILELPWWRGLNIREAELEFYEQNHIFTMSHF
ncbi:hypothetical protein CMESO_215 (nucleomorph) [Chroomonas mesostigmatica CCMP1168]|uniref:Uncharacterized protein n=1 Tax=Chroomonas mesostigmatica CCMP1168 TaxID=1195612 RepID=J7G7W0_9CRYP|nr:hypothetical protein CMESO_215 [Chroomonas mesostigmatica CCMP1168]|mmetsp:Transcript_67017/g.165293  ORF Transcript_67017/g.165293 Transcript_67017/m.165293 type:complete len:255 (+) Transcript_67017:195-959(+)